MPLILKERRSPHEVELHEKLREEAEIKRRMMEDGLEPSVKRRITVPTKATQHALIPNKSWEEYSKEKARGMHDEELLKEFHKDYHIQKGENARKAPLVFGPSTGDIKMGIRGTEDYELDQFVIPYTPPFSGNDVTESSVGEVMLPETHPEEFKKLKFSYEDYKQARKNALLQENLTEDEYYYEATDQQEIDDIARNYIERDLAMRWLGKAWSDEDHMYLKEYSAAWDKAQGLTIPFDWEGLGK